MLFKMIGIEMAGQVAGTKYRQIYVTQSRVLAEKVKEYFMTLRASTVENQDRSQRVSNETDPNDKGLLRYDDEDQTFDNLPDKLSQLTDDHFPLFITFDKVMHI